MIHGVFFIFIFAKDKSNNLTSKTPFEAMNERGVFSPPISCERFGDAAVGGITDSLKERLHSQ